MSAELLLEHLEYAAESPDAVPLVRRFILDMAVRGKLVSQNPKDESAAKLLERIAKKKRKLEKEGIIKQENLLPPVAKKDIPFQIPDNWVWTQFANIGLINPRNIGDDNMQASFIPMKLIFSDYGKSHESEIRQWHEIKRGFTHFSDGDVGVAKITPCFENGKSTIFKNLCGGMGAGTTELYVIRPIYASSDYILVFVKSSLYIDRGIPMMTGTAGQKRLPKNYFISNLFPLPPLAEQKRIVAKVDKLMALCDELEKRQNEREESRRRLVASALHELKSPPESFAKSARFVVSHFADITARPDSIKALRKTILDMAVRGKLVPQNPKDEPVAKLLERIAKEKRKLKKDGIKQKKLLPSVDKKDIPFQIPDSWKWLKSGYLLNLQYGKTLSASMRKQSGKVAVYGSNGVVGYYHEALTEDPAIIIGRKGSAGSINLSLIPSWATDVAYYLIPPSCYDIYFLAYFLSAIKVETLSKGVKPGLNRNEFYQLSISLPPLAEQKRIVAKVDKLMALCDKLESSLTATQENRRRLLVSLLRADLYQKDDNNA